jgi:hypothetical protein
MELPQAEAASKVEKEEEEEEEAEEAACVRLTARAFIQPRQPKKHIT